MIGLRRQRSCDSANLHIFQSPRTRRISRMSNDYSFTRKIGRGGCEDPMLLSGTQLPSTVVATGAEEAYQGPPGLRNLQYDSSSLNTLAWNWPLRRFICLYDNCCFSSSLSILIVALLSQFQSKPHPVCSAENLPGFPQRFRWPNLLAFHSTPTSSSPTLLNTSPMSK